jgi:hypothetical protein
MKLIVRDGNVLKCFPITGYHITGSCILIAHGTRGDFVLSPAMEYYINGVDELENRKEG